MEIHVYIKQKCAHAEIFIAMLFIIAKSWKQLKCLSIIEWISQYSHTLDYNDENENR